MNLADIYVIVRHKPTCRAFALDRGYKLLGTLEADQLEIIRVLLNENPKRKLEDWMDWKPTADWQMPDWARDLPDKEFLGIWVDLNLKWARSENSAMPPVDG